MLKKIDLANGRYALINPDRVSAILPSGILVKDVPINETAIFIDGMTFGTPLSAEEVEGILFPTSAKEAVAEPVKASGRVKK